MSPINQSVIDELNIDVAALAGVTQDSRKVNDGYLFAALQGVADGRDYIPDALRNGASFILSDNSVVLEGGVQAQLIAHDNPRAAFAHIVSAFYNGQPKNMVAVTGTNGKSSVVHFIDQIWRLCGVSSSYIGTLSGALTTPDPVTLHEELLDMKQRGVTHCAIEASSHGLDQYRIDGVNVSVAAFTSFSQDHLDYHDDMDEYLLAKTRLFTEVVHDQGVAVLNSDISEFSQLNNMCKKRGIRVLSFGEKASDVKLLRHEVVGQGQRLVISIFGEEFCVSLALVGAFQAMNVLCALSCVIAQGDVDVQSAVGALSGLSGVRGRLEPVENAGCSISAYVDYAHTPDALCHVLKALRPHTAGRLFCVFGAGGDRDKSKRPIMGRVVSELSDVAIITDDNPRSEPPETIKDEILIGVDMGVCDIHVIAGRRQAIEGAVALMSKGDVLLVAGKGHEQGQVFAGEIKEFDDASVVSDALNKYCVCISEGRETL